MLDGDPGHAIMKGIDPFADFAEVLRSADLAVCNLECVISQQGSVAHKPYTFRGAQNSLPLLQKHFDAISLANNWDPAADCQLIASRDRDFRELVDLGQASTTSNRHTQSAMASQ